MKTLACVVLAAGQGTRMKSDIPKVLHRVNNVPMICYVLEAVKRLNPDRIMVVVGRDYASYIKDSFVDKDVQFTLQKKPLGTANALLSARKALKNFYGDVLVLNGDTPLITTDTLKGFITKHRKAKNFLSVISFHADNPSGYGRVLRDKAHKACMIREEQDATTGERSIKEVNSGVYLLKSDIFSLVRAIKLNDKKGEYYLTDILGIAYKRGLRCNVYEFGDEVEFIGINTKEELLRAQRLLCERTVKYWIERDVEFMDEKRVYIHPGVVIGKGTYIYPNVNLEGNTRIGSGCIIYPNVRIADSTIGKGVIIKDSSVIESSEVQDETIIGPFARLRPETKILKGARIGNFVEIKASIIGEGTKTQHLTYIGDAQVGRNVNIGAGTITCNYDGVSKHKTIIGDDVFIGSDSQLVAPVRIEKKAYVGAGSTITKDVPSGALVLTRAEERHIKDWIKKKKAKKKKTKDKAKN